MWRTQLASTDYLQRARRLHFRGELIRRNGDIVGYISSGVKSFTLESSIAVGYVNQANGVSREWIDAGNWQIEIAGKLTASPCTPAIERNPWCCSIKRSGARGAATTS
ncbi:MULTISPECIES: glycine cleavage T C-terminal barrel domain-containing protein [Mesorhizobium]|uniref:glycine cleavage T C-terminal barrel domain-containing protein n=1 Tax=Mesorhizobium TaxID=68287 RepID=UPI001FCE7C91|nr:MULTISPECIES: glycine cleavage T C-terminal barrel domain-containing protein [Mesorhizobium]